jgi:hypothetical protein
VNPSAVKGAAQQPIYFQNTVLAGTIQIEDGDRRILRQDEQDGFPNQNQSPNGEALFLMFICSTG